MPRTMRKDSSRGTTDSRESARVRAWLIASQVGLSALLLATGGLFLKSFGRVLHADRGFTAERVLAISVPLEGAAYAQKATRNAFTEEAVRRLATLPGVVDAAATSFVPLEGESWIESIWKVLDAATTGRRRAPAASGPRRAPPRSTADRSPSPAACAARTRTARPTVRCWCPGDHG